MFEYQLTIGLYNKDTCTQKVTEQEAEAVISEALLNRFDVYAFTMIRCRGVYKMGDGRMVFEPSIRLEIASEDDISGTIHAAVLYLKMALNQESIMLKTMHSNINFI